MSSNLIELQIAEDIKEIVKREVLKLKNSPPGLDKESLMALEKVTKAYTMLMADLRENVKQGIFGKLDEEQLGSLDAERAEDREAYAATQGKSKRGRKPKVRT